MKQLTTSDIQECTASQTSTAISKPCDGLASSITVDPAQPTTFLFALEDVGGYDVQADGSLILYFTDSSSLTIPNFQQLADANFAAKLQDGTTLEFAKLAESLNADFASAPQNGIPVDVATADIKEVVAEDGTLTITLNNGETRVIDYDPSAEQVLVFADGRAILPSELEQLYKYEVAEALAEAEPAAGEEQAEAKVAAAEDIAAQQVAEELAQIEPAAGETAGAPSGGGGNFGSRIDARSLDPLNDVGPIAPTSLAFDIPSVIPAEIVATPAAAPPGTTPAAPLVDGLDRVTNEDTSVTLVVTGSSTVSDGSEFITVVITGIPSTWTMVNTNGGVYDTTTGTWTIVMPPGVPFTGGPEILPPANDDRDIPLVVTVTTTNVADGLSTSASDTFGVTVDAVVDTPTVAVGNVTVPEDNVAPLNISASVNDPDGSESITNVTITGVPADFSLSAGTRNPDGSYTLTAAQLTGLTMSSPANYSGSVNLNVAITVFDNPSDGELTLTNNTIVVNNPITVTWTPVADAPQLAINGAQQVYEDGQVTLNTSATLVDRDGSESMVVEIVGIPADWTMVNLNGGTYNAATQTWTISIPAGADFTGGPTIAPPADSDVNLPLTLRATTTDGTDTATSTTPFTVVVDAVADGVNLSATNAAGEAGDPIPLTLSTSLRDVDGSEEITSITLSGIPAGHTLSAGTYNAGTNTWTLTTAQLTGLTVTSPSAYAGNYTVTMTVNSRERVATDSDFDLTNNTAVNTTTFNVAVDLDARPPIINVNGGTDGQVYEDNSVVLPVTVTGQGTTGETMVVTFSGLPAGWTITPTLNGTVVQTGTTITVTLPANTDLSGSIRFTPPANSDVDSPTITVTAVATETSNGDTATSTDTFVVEVDAVADAPNLTAGAATGNEDTPVALNITTSLNDTDGSETLTSVRISGLPAGATLSAGTLNPDGSYTLTVAQLVGLTLTPPTNFSGNIALTVVSTATETALNGVDFDLTNNVATTTRTLNVTISPVADDPTLIITPAQVFEDNSVTLNVQSAPTDPSESLTITIGNLIGWTVPGLNGGTFNATTGVWSITLPAGVAFNGGPTVAPPANSDLDRSLPVTVTSTDGASTRTLTGTLPVLVDAVADVPNLTVANATGNEDTAIPLTINTSLNDTDNSEVLSIVISGVPAGATLSAGTLNANGTWSLTPAQLVGLSITPPANFSGTILLQVASTATEQATGAQEITTTNNVATVLANLTVTVNPQADTPTLTINPAQVYEDNAVTLSVQAAPTDPSESLTISIGNITAGWTVTALNGGTFNAATGVWTITLAPGQSFNGGPTVAPPANSDVNRDLTVTVTSTDGASTANATGTLPVIVDAVADGVNVNAGPDVNQIGTAPIALNLATSLRDTDGSEEITSVTLSGIPAGFTLSAGTYNAGTNTWTLTTAQFAGLTMTPSASFAGNFTVTMTVNSRERVATDSDFDLTNNTASNSDSFNVVINPTVLPPIINVNGGADGQVYEDNSVVLPVTVTGQGTANETMVVTISGLPTGWVITPTLNGTLVNNGTSWTITLPANTDLSGSIRFTPPANSDVDSPTITITAVATEPSTGQTATSTDTFVVEVDAVADGTNVNAGPDVVTAAGSTVALDLSTSLRDTDGSEEITSVTLTGIPSQVTLNQGVRNADGSWTLTPAQFAGLTMTGAAGFAGNFTVTMTVNSRERVTDTDFDFTNNTASNSDSFNVTFNNLPTGPTVIVDTANDCVFEDTTFTLPFTANYGGGDGDEFMTITVTGLPAGWTIITNGVGTLTGTTWTLTLPAGQQDFTNTTLQIRPPLNSQADYTGINVTATLTDPNNGNATSTVTVPMPLEVDAVVDGVDVTTTNLTAYYFDETITTTGGVNHVNFAANFSFTYRDNDGSERITNIEAIGPNAHLITGLYINADGQLCGTFNWTGGRDMADFSVTVRITTYDFPQDGECTLTNNTMTQDVVLNFDPVRVYTPLAIDLDGNGLQFTSLHDGVTFDIDGDGDRDQTAWLSGGDAFLAIDRNGDGTINDISELFGNDNGAYEDGFAKLATYDVNGDGKISAEDGIFNELRLWTDRNGDGVSQADELYSLSDMGVASINLATTERLEILGDDIGVITDRATVTMVDGSTRDIADVWFRYIENLDSTQEGINDFVHKTDEGPQVLPAEGGSKTASTDPIICPTPADNGSAALDQIDQIAKSAG